MYVASVGRNDPCPCGSKKKYKKCCLPAASEARATQDGDAAQIVDRAIASEDWGPVNTVLASAFAMLESGSPLEYLRFLDDQVVSEEPSDAELARWSSSTWLRWCDSELVIMLEQPELAAYLRAGLQMALHLLRRFGARSPVVEYIAKLQVDERAERERRFEAALQAHGLRFAELREGVSELQSWLQQERLQILTFPEWFALRVARPEQHEIRWRSGISGRVFDRCMDALEALTGEAVRPWLQLAAMSLARRAEGLAGMLCYSTEPRSATPSEQRVVDAVLACDAGSNAYALWPAIEDERQVMNDFAGAALIRDAIQYARDAARARKR